MLLNDLIKAAIMHPLQERVVGLGLCPKCHTKTLAPVYEDAGMQFNQCSHCKTVYVTVSEAELRGEYGSEHEASNGEWYYAPPPQS